MNNSQSYLEKFRNLFNRLRIVHNNIQEYSDDIDKSESSKIKISEISSDKALKNTGELIQVDWDDDIGSVDYIGHVLFTKKFNKDGDVLNLECCICIEPYSIDTFIRRLKCGHTFHQSCIDKWLIAKYRDDEALLCPLCRKNTE